MTALDEFLRRARVLIVDDDRASVSLLKDILTRAGYFSIEIISDEYEVMKSYVRFAPDLILLDLRMSHLDGFRAMEKLRQLIPQETYLPVLVLTTDVTSQVRKTALSAGAKDFLTKPYDAAELFLRVCNLLEARFYHLRSES